MARENQVVVVEKLKSQRKKWQKKSVLSGMKTGVRTTAATACTNAQNMVVNIGKQNARQQPIKVTSHHGQARELGRRGGTAIETISEFDAKAGVHCEQNFTC